MDKEFSAQLVKLMPRLRGHAITLLRSPSDADDLLQDVMVRAWRFRHTFRPGTNMAAWLFRIMRNQFLTNLRQKTPDAHYGGEDWRVEFSTPAEQEWKRTFNELLARMEEISEPRRQALLLVGACGFTYQEAADVCNCAPGTMKSRVSRARDRMAELMDPSRRPGETDGARAHRAAA
jgi:RNA polymerase sigma-70 factor (ECF subfamily)